MRNPLALAAAGLSLLLVVILGLPGAEDEAQAEAATSHARPAAKPFTVGPTMTMNDPIRNRGVIARQLKTYINHTPRGATIRIMSFFLGSAITMPALRAAYNRGVHIQVVVNGGPYGRPQLPLSWQAAELQKMFAAGRKHGRTGSWVVWTKQSGRGDHPAGVMHAKVWQFSQVGATKKVTMIGSYNNGQIPDGRAYSAMVTLTDPKLYDATKTVIAQTARDRYVGKNPQRRASGDGWTAYYFPSKPITKANDPVMKRLAAIPANADTEMTISMFSMQAARGIWVAHKLAAMVRKGAKLTFVVGPDVVPPVVAILRKAGARLEDGCWRTGRKDFPYAFTHDKEMTATWLVKTKQHPEGERRYGAWLGSDDWGSGAGGSLSDQVVVGLDTKWAYDRLNRLLAPQIAHTPDILTACNPV